MQENKGIIIICRLGFILQVACNASRYAGRAQQGQPAFSHFASKSISNRPLFPFPTPTPTPIPIALSGANRVVDEE